MLADLRKPDARQLEALLLHVHSLTSSGVRANILDWGEENVIFPHSDRRSTFDRDFAPWFNDPLDAFASGDFRVISFVGPTGCGKSTFLELLTCYVIAQDPGHTLIVGQSDDDITKWGETRLMPMLDKVAAVNALMPTRQYAKRKTEIIFPHMPLYLGGANLNNLQSSSCRYVFCDEVWTFAAGMVTEAMARLHDRANGVFICMGQAGIEKDEHYNIHESTQKHNYEWHCPKCERVNAYSTGPEQLIFDEIRGERGQLDLPALARSVRLRCICGAEFEDNLHNRKSLSMNSQYKPVQSNAWPGRIGFHMHVLGVWWIEWRQIALERVIAIERMRMAETTSMRQFKQKREAFFWSEEEQVPKIQLQAGGYGIGQFANGELIDGETVRFFSLDRQAGYFWGIVRAWRADGSSRLLFADKITDQSQILELQARYKVPWAGVCIDTRYDTAAMRVFCQRHGFLAIMGDKADSWVHVETKGQPGIKKPYSPVTAALTIENQPVNLVYFSTLHIKDVLNLLRMGRFRPFEVPNDVGDTYSKHMASEIKKNIASETAAPKMQWVALSHRENHLWDCEAMQVCMAIMFDLIRLDDKFQVELT